MSGQFKSNLEKVTCLFALLLVECAFVIAFVGENHPQSYKNLN